MRIDKNIEDLELIMAKHLYDINADGEKKDLLIAFLKEKGYLVGTATSMVSGNIPVEALSEIDLYVLLTEMYNATGIIELNPSKWITDNEIKTVKEYRELSSRYTLTMPLVLNNVLEVVEDEQWIFVADIAFVNQLYNAKMIKYNFKTQRNPKLVKMREGFKEVPNTNKLAIPQIVKKIQENRYTSNTITFNLNKNKHHDFTYDKKTMTLTISEGDIDILDGWHRCLAMMSLLVINPDFKFNFELRFVNYTEERAAEFVKQENIRNKISEQHLASITMSDLSNSATKGLNENITSDMRGKIATDRAYIREGSALTMFKTISETIDMLWDLIARVDASNLSNYLIEFFNQLIALKKDEMLTNVIKNRRKNYINHEGMFIFYLTLAKEIEDKENKYELLKYVIDNTNFNKNNPFWGGLGVITISEQTIARHRDKAIIKIKKYIKDVLNNAR